MKEPRTIVVTVSEDATEAYITDLVVAILMFQNVAEVRVPAAK